MNLTVTAAPGHNILHLWLTIVTNYSAIFCYWICLFRSTGSVESVIHKMQEYILIQLIKRANRIPDFKMTVHQQEKLFVFFMLNHCPHSWLSLFFLYIIFAYSMTLCVLFADDPQLHGTPGAHKTPACSDHSRALRYKHINQNTVSCQSCNLLD